MADFALVAEYSKFLALIVGSVRFGIRAKCIWQIVLGANGEHGIAHPANVNVLCGVILYDQCGGSATEQNINQILVRIPLVYHFLLQIAPDE